MPHPDHRFQAHVYVACAGPDQAPTSGTGPRGKLYSKSQTTLQYAVADVLAWSEHMRNGPHDRRTNEINHHQLLKSATAAQFRDAIEEAINRLDFHFDQSAGGTINLIFSGHGTVEGELVLADRSVPPDELMEWCSGGRAGENGKTRHLRIVIDSCYSGLTLCHMLVNPHHMSRLVVRDGFAASLPNEEAFELRRLGHSVLTYSMIRPGAFLMRKISQEGPDSLSASEIRELKAANRETTSYLTNGKQHSLDVINGHGISLRGRRATVELLDLREGNLEELVDAVTALPTRRKTPS